MIKSLDSVPCKERQWGHSIARNMITVKKKIGLGRASKRGALAIRKGPSRVDEITYVASNFVPPVPSFASGFRLLGSQALKSLKDNVDYYRKNQIILVI